MYATNSGTDSFYSMDRESGLTTLIGPLGSGSTNPNGLAYNWDNQTMYLVDNSADNLYTIDLGSGAATLVGTNGSGNLLGLVYIPEPATLLTFGAAAAMLLRRRRANR
jgi:sugar lactone lactonase YvrE